MDKQEAVARLHEMLKPGDTVQTILRHVSRSGMLRSVSPIIGCEDQHWLVMHALGLKFDQKNGGLKLTGCGMDMGFHLVYELSYRLFPDGFGCIGEACPSNDHSNGDRDYTPHGSIAGCSVNPCTCHDKFAWAHPGSYPNGCSQCGCNRVQHWHKDGGYAIKQRWL